MGTSVRMEFVPKQGGLGADVPVAAAATAADTVYTGEGGVDNGSIDNRNTAYGGRKHSGDADRDIGRGDLAGSGNGDKGDSGGSEEAPYISSGVGVPRDSRGEESSEVFDNDKRREPAVYNPQYQPNPEDYGGRSVIGSMREGFGRGGGNTFETDRGFEGGREQRVHERGFEGGRERAVVSGEELSGGDRHHHHRHEQVART